MTKEEIIELCDSRYKRREDCEADMADVNKKLANDDKRLAVIEFQIKLNNWLTAAIAGGIVALLVDFAADDIVEDAEVVVVFGKLDLP